VQVARLTFREGSFEVEVEWKDQGREELAPTPSLRA